MLFRSTVGQGVFWGTVSGGTFNQVTGTTLFGVPVSATSETFGVDNVILANANLSASTNDPWYYALFDYTKSVSVGSYYGFGFGAALNAIGTGATSTQFTGTCKIYATYYSGSPYSDYDDLVVATLRSRGITTYTTDNGPVYEVSGTSGATMVCNGIYSGITKNPYGTFVISGVTKDNDNFSFETSLNSTDSKYISKIFGRSNFGKDRNEVPLFVEESYSSLLTTGYRLGKVRGLYCDFISIGGARSGDNDSLGFYLEQYQTPETPYVVSELRGNKVYKLFKFVLISDGNAANRLVKISIGNISFNNGTFDVFVRDFFDNDENVRVIESFTNCSLDPNQNNYVANKIGTSNGEYQVKSKYIMLEMSEDRKSTRLNSSHVSESRMPSSA